MHKLQWSRLPEEVGFLQRRAIRTEDYDAQLGTADSGQQVVLDGVIAAAVGGVFAEADSALGRFVESTDLAARERRVVRVFDAAAYHMQSGRRFHVQKAQFAKQGVDRVGGNLIDDPKRGDSQLAFVLKNADDIARAITEQRIGPVSFRRYFSAQFPPTAGIARDQEGAIQKCLKRGLEVSDDGTSHSVL